MVGVPINLAHTLQWNCFLDIDLILNPWSNYWAMRLSTNRYQHASDIPYLLNASTWWLLIPVQKLSSLPPPCAHMQVPNHMLSMMASSETCDCSYFREHPLFRAHPDDLQLQLFHNDVEVVKSLGTKVQKHKLCTVLITVTSKKRGPDEGAHTCNWVLIQLTIKWISIVLIKQVCAHFGLDGVQKASCKDAEA